MGYCVYVDGKLKMDKKLPKDFIDYFNAFARTRHASRSNKKIKETYPDWKERSLDGYLGPDGLFFTCDDQNDNRDDNTYKNVNEINKYCPSFWCGYEIDKKGDLIPVGDFRYNTQIYWLYFIIDTFMEPLNVKLSGTLTYQGDLPYDSGKIIVKNNEVVVDKHKKVKWGLLCESESIAKEMGYDYTTGYNFTGLDTYLREIFKDVQDWEYKKPLVIKNKSGKKIEIIPTYKSEKLKIVIMFYDISHYKTKRQLLKDKKIAELIKQDGNYKLVEIPYYIELTKEVVKKLFNVNVKNKLFNILCPSMTAYNGNTPYFMCKDGFDEMMSNFEAISKEQYEITREHLDWLDFGTGLSGVEKFYDM